MEEAPTLQVVYERTGGKILKILVVNDRLSDEQMFLPAGDFVRLESVGCLRRAVEKIEK